MRKSPIQKATYIAMLLNLHLNSTAEFRAFLTGGDFGSRHRIKLAVVPQKGVVRLWGYYEIEVTDAAAFDGAASATSAMKPEDRALYRSAGSLYQPGTELYKPGQTPVVLETEKEVRVVMAADVLFDFDKAMIRPDAVSSLKQAAVIREKHRAIVRIEGHTDSRAGSVYNMQLSRQRAVAVENWLVQNEGFDVAIFRTQGFGATWARRTQCEAGRQRQSGRQAEQPSGRAADCQVKRWRGLRDRRSRTLRERQGFLTDVC